MKEYYKKSKANKNNILFSEKYYNKIKELEELKDIQIQNRRNALYESELELLKDKQRDIYNDFICDYNTKRDELELKYQYIIENVKNKNKEEKKEIYKNNSKKDKELINKNILINKKNINLII